MQSTSIHVPLNIDVAMLDQAYLFLVTSFSNNLFTFSAFLFNLSLIDTIAESTTLLFSVLNDWAEILSAIISDESFVDKLFVPTRRMKMFGLNSLLVGFK